MKGKTLIVGGLVAALAVAPVSSAWAWRDHDHHWHGGPLFWPFAAAAAIVVGAATIATLPFRAVAAATYPGPYYYPPQPAPAYYAPPQQGYYPPQQGYYPPQQGYYPPQQGYYAAPPAYYPPPPGYAPYSR
jgi:annexin A7/11